jgi:hypothetical protein
MMWVGLIEVVPNYLLCLMEDAAKYSKSESD